MPEIAFVNGSFLPLNEAVIPIEDRGFQFADGVYEVVATYNGRPYALEAHLQRLQRSLQEIRIYLDIGKFGLEDVLFQGLDRSAFHETLVYIQITRGVAARRHEFPSVPASPTVVLTFKELHRPAAENYEDGVAVISASDLRWRRCDIKSTALLANILAKQNAAEVGAFEALLVDAEGRITEGSSTSAFCVREGVVWTAPEGGHILPSITRAILLEVMCREGLQCRQEFSTLPQYLAADEVFIAGTSTEAMPVVTIDGKCIGDGTPGPITRRIRGSFLETIDD